MRKKSKLLLKALKAMEAAKKRDEVEVAEAIRQSTQAMLHIMDLYDSEN